MNTVLSSKDTLVYFAPEADSMKVHIKFAWCFPPLANMSVDSSATLDKIVCVRAASLQAQGCLDSDTHTQTTHTLSLRLPSLCTSATVQGLSHHFEQQHLRLDVKRWDINAEVYMATQSLISNNKATTLLGHYTWVASKHKLGLPRAREPSRSWLVWRYSFAPKREIHTSQF